MSPAAKRLVVLGGNGFLGSRVCKFAVQRGWEVTSISRSGEPRWKSVSDSASPPYWARSVTWERADVFRPETYAPLFRGANYAVHSLGILLEADYKGLVSGRDSPLAGLQKVLGGQPQKSTASGDNAGKPQKLTYEAMNRDSALLAARAAADGGVEAFAYISAAAGAPGLPSRYITTKREAERLLAAASSSTSSEFPSPLHRPIFVRAPLMYDAASRPMTLPIAAVAGAGTLFNRATGGALSGILGSVGTKPLQVDDVAEAVVESLSDDKVEGAIEVPRIAELANRAWRKGML